MQAINDNDNDNKELKESIKCIRSPSLMQESVDLNELKVRLRFISQLESMSH